MNDSNWFFDLTFVASEDLRCTDTREWQKLKKIVEQEK